MRGGERKWNVWSSLSEHIESREIGKRFEAVVRSKEQRPEAGDVRELLEVGVEALAKLWRAALNQLNSRGERERFFDVEVPVQSIFHQRQAAGIRVSQEEAARLARVVANEKYTAYAAVADMLHRSPTGLNFWNIQPYLSGTDVADLAEEKDGGRLRDIFKLAAGRSAFARSYLAFSEAGRDESTLRRALTREGRVYPEFHIHGTVTGRVLVSDPHIQQVRRKYRRFVEADADRKLAYLDYAQFEPGILAFLSRDEGLVAAYNQGDIYQALSQAVYGSFEHRPLSKKIFLAYSYGMTTTRIARLLLGAAAPEDEKQELEGKINAFFAAFPGLVSHRDAMHRVLLEQGFVESVLGNRRWRTSQGALTQKEMRWAVNQPVQATASLIFKEALIELNKRFGWEAILVPMHDAVLLQLHLADWEAQVEEAREIMVQAYKARCPGIFPRVTVTDFAEA
jgi:DNA polymerase-1